MIAHDREAPSPPQERGGASGRFSPPAPPRAGEVHVWLVSAVEPPEAPRAYLRSLSPDEVGRADAFARAADRRRFVIGRGALRALLGAYLAQEPGQVPLVTEANGKPALAPHVATGDVRFNLAHSGEWIVIAATLGSAVGADVERIRAVEAEAIAERFFAGEEAAALRALPPALRREAFFTCWTRKEAFVKAVGEGLSFPLRRFAVTVDPREPAALLRLDGASAQAAGWTLQSLVPAPGYAAAVAAETPRARFFFGQWTAAEGAQPWRPVAGDDHAGDDHAGDDYAGDDHE